MPRILNIVSTMRRIALREIVSRGLERGEIGPGKTLMSS